MKDMISDYITPVGAILVALVALLMSAFWLTAISTERQIEQAVRKDFTAAGYLSRLQVEGEKMRRYEKEAFIHINDSRQRQVYFNEFDGTYTHLLALLDGMQAPSSPTFTDADRSEMAQWKLAALFYGSQFTALLNQASLGDADKTTAEQRASRTLDFNARIADGKNRFPALLTGTERMRQQKEAGAQTIASDIAYLLLMLRISIALSGLALAGLLLYLLRPLPAAPRATQAQRRLAPRLGAQAALG